MKLNEIMINEKDIHGIPKVEYSTIKNDILNIIYDMCEGNIKPATLYNNFIKGGSKSKFKCIGNSIMNCIDIKANYGYRKTNAFVNTAGKIYLKDYINSTYEVVTTEYYSYITEYSEDNLYDISRYAISLMIARYDVHTLTPLHILYNVLGYYATYFDLKLKSKIFDNDPRYILNVYERIMNTDYTEFDNIIREKNLIIEKDMSKNAPKSSIIRCLESTPKKLKPTCLEDLTVCFDGKDDELSQKEKKELIMKWWKCGDRTARGYMSQFGLTEKKYVTKKNMVIMENSDMQKIADNVVDVFNEVVEVEKKIDTATDDIIVSMHEENVDMMEHIDNRFDDLLNTLCGLNVTGNTEVHKRIKARNAMKNYYNATPMYNEEV